MLGKLLSVNLRNRRLEPKAMQSSRTIAESMAYVTLQTFTAKAHKETSRRPRSGQSGF